MLSVSEKVVVVIATSDSVAKESDPVVTPTNDSPAQEFVSDNFRPSSQELEEVREGMKKLGLEAPSAKGNVYLSYGEKLLVTDKIFEFNLWYTLILYSKIIKHLMNENNVWVFQMIWVLVQLPWINLTSLYFCLREKSVINGYY